MTYAAGQFALPTPLVIGMYSMWCPMGAYLLSIAAGAPATMTGPAANQAIFVPFVVTTTATFTRGFWANGSVPANAGNIAVGIYDTAGTRLATTGAVAASGASVIQSAAFAASVTLTPGYYYMAYEASATGANTCLGFTSSNQFKAAGALTQAVGSHPLPSPATFATFTAMTLPQFGIAQTSFAL